MSKRKMNAKEKILRFLSKDEGYNTLTLAQAMARFGSGAAARIHELRLEGNAIYTNVKTYNGRKIRVYRLGNPSERFVRNLEEGRTVLAVKALTGVAA